jgi:hypothetical protein
MRFPVSLAVLFVASAIATNVPRSAGAQGCPTAKSAASGYVIERDGSSKTEVLFSDDTTVRMIMRSDGKVLLERSQFQGLFELDRIDRGRRAVFKPKTDLAALFPLKPGKSATVEFEVEGSGRPPTAAVQISVKGTDVLHIGACKYNVLKIERNESRGGGSFAFQGTDYYSPDLKLVIGREYRDSGGKTTMIRFDRIAPLKP